MHGFGKYDLGAPFIVAQGVRQSRHVQDLPQAGLAIAAGHDEGVVKAPHRAAAVSFFYWAWTPFLSTAWWMKRWRRLIISGDAVVVLWPNRL